MERIRRRKTYYPHSKEILRQLTEDYVRFGYGSTGFNGVCGCGLSNEERVSDERSIKYKGKWEKTG